MSTKEEFIKRALMGVSEKHDYVIPINKVYNKAITGRFDSKKSKERIEHENK